MLCEFCMTTVYNLYFFDSAGCGAFPYEQQAACTKISDALFKKSTEVVTQMNQYVSTMGVAGGATEIYAKIGVVKFRVIRCNNPPFNSFIRV